MITKAGLSVSKEPLNLVEPAVPQMGENLRVFGNSHIDGESRNAGEAAIVELATINGCCNG